MPPKVNWDEPWGNRPPATVQEAGQRLKAAYGKWEGQASAAVAQANAAHAGRRTAEKRADQAEARVGELERRAELQVFEPDIYAPGSGHSWFADAARVALKEGGGDGGVEAARRRLDAHEQYEHRRTDRRLRVLQAERAAEAALTRTRAETSLYLRWSEAGGRLFEMVDELKDVERLSASRTLGSGGYFSPPAWLIERFVHAPRAGAPLAALMTGLPIPPGTDSINVPRFAAGASMGRACRPLTAARSPTAIPLRARSRRCCRPSSSISIHRCSSSTRALCRSMKPSAPTSPRTSPPNWMGSSC